MKMDSLSKANIRKTVLKKRNGVSVEWREMASSDIARTTLTFVLNGPGGPVAGYWPYKSEADPRDLMGQLGGYGRTLALPVMTDPHIIFRRYIDGVDLVDAGFGTLGPDASADTLRPAILLVPLAAFDSNCNRIGWGQGHYDRIIDHLRADGGPLLTVGIAFSFQQVDNIPIERHDQPLDLIVTEQKVFRRS